MDIYSSSDLHCIMQKTIHEASSVTESLASRLNYHQPMVHHILRVPIKLHASSLGHKCVSGNGSESFR